MIYLASPYSHPDPSIREQRFEEACQAAAGLMREGLTVFCPVAHSHPIAQYGLPTTWEYWEQVDRKHLGICDELVVLMLDSWEESRGVAAEIEIAQELGLPVRFVSPTLATVATGANDPTHALP